MISSRKPRIEDDIQPGKLRDRSEHIAAACGAEDERVGQLRVGRQIEPWRREAARALDQRLELGFSVARHRDLRPELLTNVAQRFVHEGIAGVQLRRELVLAERFFVALGAGEGTSTKCVGLGRAQLGAIERQPGVVVVGVGREAPWCIPRRRGRSSSPPPRARPRAGRRSWRSRPPGPGTRPARTSIVLAQRLTGPALVTSAPRGIEKANVLSATPGFSLKFVNRKVDRLPCFSATVRDWRRSVSRAAVISSQSYSG